MKKQSDKTPLNVYKTLIIGGVLLLVLFYKPIVFAADYGLDEAASTAGINTEVNFISVVGNIIDGILAFLGLIFVILIIVGGIQWMTSAGSPDKVKSAKGLIVNAIIGLVIVMASFALIKLVFGMLGIGWQIGG